MSTPLRVSVMRLSHGADLPLPDYATEGSAGLDLVAAVPRPTMLRPGERALVPTGIAYQMHAIFAAAESAGARRHIVGENPVAALFLALLDRVLDQILSLGGETDEKARPTVSGIGQGLEDVGIGDER